MNDGFNQPVLVVATGMGTVFPYAFQANAIAIYSIGSDRLRMAVLGRGCVKTLDTSKFGGARIIAEVPIVDPAAFYEVDLFVYSSIREFLHSLGRNQTLPVTSGFLHIDSVSPIRHPVVSSWCRPLGTVVPLSQAPHVPSSTSSCRAASLIDQPMARCLARRRSAMFFGSGKGSWPKNRIMAGMDSIGGSVWTFSQFRIVLGLTPSRSAACFWVSPGSSRRFLTCSPKICGSK